MSFFTQFPRTTYDIRFDNRISEITNIFSNVDINEKSLDSFINYKLERIEDGERPDQMSQRLYNTSDYYWTFFIANDFLKKGINAWPKGFQQREDFINNEYKPYSVLVLDAENIRKICNIPNILDKKISLASKTDIEIHKIDETRQQIWLKGNHNILNGVSNIPFAVPGSADPFANVDDVESLSISNMAEGNGTYTRDVDINGAPSWKYVDENGDENILAIKPYTISGFTYYVWTVYDPVDDDPVHREGALDGQNVYRTLESSQSITPWGNSIVGWENASSTYDPSNYPIFDNFVYNIAWPYEALDGFAYAENAPYSYNVYDSNTGDIIQTTDFISYKKHLENEDEERSFIKVVQPSLINTFTDEYKRLINE